MTKIFTNETRIQKNNLLSFFSLIFYFVLSMKTRLLQFISLCMGDKVTGGGRRRKGYHQNSFRNLRRSLRPFLTISDIHFYLFSIFPPKLQNDLLSSIMTKIDEIWWMGFDWCAIWYSEAGMDGFRLKFSCA